MAVLLLILLFTDDLPEHITYGTAFIFGDSTMVMSTKNEKLLEENITVTLNEFSHLPHQT